MTSRDIVEPIVDPWRLGRRGGQWVIEQCVDIASESALVVNSRFATILNETCDSFKGLLRPWLISIEAPSKTALERKFFDLQWPDDVSSDQFKDSALARIRDCVPSLSTMTVKFDTNAYATTKRAPESPQRAWLRLPITYR